MDSFLIVGNEVGYHLLSTNEVKEDLEANHFVKVFKEVLSDESTVELIPNDLPSLESEKVVVQAFIEPQNNLKISKLTSTNFFKKSFKSYLLNHG